MDTFKKLEQYTDVSRNFSNYRSIVKTALEEAKNQNWTNNKIVIPFTSLLLKDIYFIKTHSGDYTEQGGINLKVSLINIIGHNFDHLELFLSLEISIYR